MARKHRKKVSSSRSNRSKRSRHAMKKKSPAQLDREIAEALFRSSRRSHSTKTVKIKLPPVYVRTRSAN